MDPSVFSENYPPERPRMSVSVSALVCIAIAAALLASMTTFIFLRTSFNAERDRMYADYDEALSALEQYGQIAEDLAQIDAMYKAYYPGEIDEEELRKYVINGYIAGTGDRYGFYYDPETAEEFLKSLSGESEGIGVTVIFDAKVSAIQVVSVYKDSPAAEAGLMVGDYIAYVKTAEGERLAVSEIGYDMALAHMKGEKGTDAEFTVFRDSDGDGVYDEIDFKITRAPLSVESVTQHIYSEDPTVGIIRISSFEQNTPDQFKAAVEDLRSKGATSLVFDVRYNPGGDKDSVCSILDYLLPEGPIMRTVDAEGNYTVIAESDKSFIDMPMAVIMNGSSASAAELFASCLKDYDAAVLVGENSFGKGTMQNITSIFGDGSLLKITTDLYCPPYSENYDGVGIAPDVEVALDEALLEKNFYTITDAEDNQLRAAVEALAK